MLQRVAACCSVLQRVAVCCSVLQCVTVCCSVLQCVTACCSEFVVVTEKGGEVFEVVRGANVSVFDGVYVCVHARALALFLCVVQNAFLCYNLVSLWQHTATHFNTLQHTGTHTTHVANAPSQ